MCYRNRVVTKGAAGDAFEALGDPNRRTIVELLRRGPSSVGELADQMPISRPAVSRHLRLLRGAGLVTEEAQKAVAAAIGAGWIAKGRIGMGLVAEVPWVGIYPADVAPSAQSGFYVVFGLGQIFLWLWWQKRGAAKPATPELETSAYGRPLVRGS